MRIEFFDQYQREFTEKEVLRSLRMPADHAFGASIADLLERTDKIANPKAFFMECKPEEVTKSTVTIEGVTFSGANLIQRIGEADVLYPYLSTCGNELAEFASGLTDVMEQFAMDAVMEFYRRQIDAVVTGAMQNEIPEGMQLSKTNPGSLAGWPIQQQKPLFELFGEVSQRAGVRLTDTFLMFPVKTVAGIAYGGESTDVDCEVCQRKKCPNRKAKFNMQKYLTLADADEM